MAVISMILFKKKFLHDIISVVIKFRGENYHCSLLNNIFIKLI